MARCIGKKFKDWAWRDCKRQAREGSEYCAYCDPEKVAARKRASADRFRDRIAKENERAARIRAVDKAAAYVVLAALKELPDHPAVKAYLAAREAAKDE